MNPGEVILLIIRWIHSVSAVTWIGGGIFYLLVLRPVVQASQLDSSRPYRELGLQFRNIVNTSIAILIVTGTVLMVSRLAEPYTGTGYIVVLAIKLCLAAYMFYLVKFRIHNSDSSRDIETNNWPSRLSRALTGVKMITLLGVTIFLLADILSFLIEDALQS